MMEVLRIRKAIADGYQQSMQKQVANNNLVNQQSAGILVKHKIAILHSCKTSYDAMDYYDMVCGTDEFRSMTLDDGKNLQDFIKKMGVRK